MADVGMYQNRARWLDTRTGRFVSVDPERGSAIYPVSMVPYLYGSQSPVSYLDPTGREFTLAGTLTTISVGAVLGGLSTVGYLHATGQAVTLQAVMIGAAVGAATGGAGLIAPEVAAFLVGVGVTTSVHTIAELYPIIADSSLPFEQRIAAAGMVVSAFCGSAAALSYVTAARGNPRILADDFGETGLTAPLPPNNGFLGTPTRTFLYAGETMDRFGGSDNSRFFSPVGTSPGARSMPSSTQAGPLRTFRVVKPFEVEEGFVAAAYGQKGNGIQYRAPVPLGTLLKWGVVQEVKDP